MIAWTWRAMAVRRAPWSRKESIMPRLACSLALILCSAALWAADPPRGAPAGKVVRDHWDAASLDGNRAGYIRTVVREIERDGKKYYHTTISLDLTLRRFQEIIRQQMESGTVETADGAVTGVWMSQTLGKDQKLQLQGVVKGDQLQVKVSGPMSMEKSIRWDPNVVGLYREQQLFQEKKVKAGDSFSYLHYEPLINAVVTVQVAVKDAEEVAIGGALQKLLRAEAVPAPIMGVQLPVTVFWLGADLLPVRSQVEMPGLGKLTLARATKEAALAPVTAAKITDIGLTQLITLNKRLVNPHQQDAIIYKLTLPGDVEPSKAIAADGRQQIKNAQGKSFELHVKALRQPAAMKDAPPAADEFLKSNYFIASDDARVRELARQAVGKETDPWQQAIRIERWVHNNMKSQNFSEAMATADNVARRLEGDCTEYAMLTAAMCRAVGVPSRTALGFVYVDMPKTPVFGYHMWTEVYVQGQWLALDATLGQGSVGPAHIKITDHSWHDTRSLAPLLPVMRVMLGKVAVEVLRGGDGE